MVYYCL